MAQALLPRAISRHCLTRDVRRWQSLCRSCSAPCAPLWIFVSYPFSSAPACLHPVITRLRVAAARLLRSRRTVEFVIVP